MYLASPSVAICSTALPYFCTYKIIINITVRERQQPRILSQVKATMKQKGKDTVCKSLQSNHKSYVRHKDVNCLPETQSEPQMILIASHSTGSISSQHLLTSSPALVLPASAWSHQLDNRPQCNAFLSPSSLPPGCL